MSDKTQEEILSERLNGAGLAGSGGRSNALGANDPRHRRGSQTESVPTQRFDPDAFTVDSEQRVALVSSSTAPPQVACIEGDANAIAGADTYVTMGLNAATTSTGTYITVDTTSNYITLLRGHVYMISVDVLFRNSDKNNQRSGTVKIRSTGGTSYGERTVLISAASDEHGGTRDFGASAFLSAVVDLTTSVDLNIDIQVKGNDAEIFAGGGWITVQSL